MLSACEADARMLAEIGASFIAALPGRVLPETDGVTGREEP